MRGKKIQSKQVVGHAKPSQKPLLIKRERIRSEETNELSLVGATGLIQNAEFDRSARVSFMKQLKECQMGDQTLEETITKLSQTLKITKRNEQPIVKKLGAELVPLSQKGRKTI